MKMREETWNLQSELGKVVKANGGKTLAVRSPFKFGETRGKMLDPKGLSRVSLILIKRLLHWPVLSSRFDLSELTPEDILKYRPQSNYVSEELREKDDDWHKGRVCFFYNQLLDRQELTPIILDNRCSGPHILPVPVLIDGYHRLAAHIVAGQESVATYYSGRLDLLDYLTGHKSKIPEE